MGAPRLAAHLPRRVAGRRQDLRDAQRGTPARRARHRRRGRRRRDPRPGADRRAAAATWRSSPRRTIEYRGTTLPEMDVDAVLARRPDVALVDELAHTNVPGSRHDKRWQDVEELLDAGIDVITTFNVQHLESLNDVVNQITGTIQRETVPDVVVRRADQIELIDMSPEAIRRRMAHGNIYAGRADRRRARQLLPARQPRRAPRAGPAVGRRPGRRGAARLPRDATASPTAWETRERVVVGLTGVAGGEALIRRAARMAGRLGGELIGVHVARRRRSRAHTPDRRSRSSASSCASSAARCSRWSATTRSRRSSTSPASANATQLVLGASRRSRWHELLARLVRRPARPRRRPLRRPRDRTSRRRPTAGTDVRPTRRDSSAARPGAPRAGDAGRRSSPCRCSPWCSPRPRRPRAVDRAARLPRRRAGHRRHRRTGRRRGRRGRRLADRQLVLRRPDPHVHDHRGRERRRPRRVRRRRRHRGLAGRHRLAAGASRPAGPACRPRRWPARRPTWSAEPDPLPAHARPAARHVRRSTASACAAPTGRSGRPRRRRRRRSAVAATCALTGPRARCDRRARRLSARSLSADEQRVLRVVADQLERGDHHPPARPCRPPMPPAWPRSTRSARRCCARCRTTCAARWRRSRRWSAGCATPTCTGRLRSSTRRWRRSRTRPTGSTASSATCSTPAGCRSARWPPTCSRTHLGEVVEAALRSIAAPDGAVVVEIADDLPAVLADGVLLERCVANLVTNALRFNPCDAAPVQVDAAAVGDRGAPAHRRPRSGHRRRPAARRWSNRSSASATCATATDVGLGLSIAQRASSPRWTASCASTTPPAAA